MTNILTFCTILPDFLNMRPEGINVTFEVLCTNACGFHCYLCDIPKQRMHQSKQNSCAYCLFVIERELVVNEVKTGRENTGSTIVFIQHANIKDEIVRNIHNVRVHDKTKIVSPL